MAAKMSVLGLMLSAYPYLRSAMVRFPLYMGDDVALWKIHDEILKKKVGLPGRDGKTFQGASNAGVNFS